MSDLQVQARALGDPTRHAVFEFLVAADRPVGVAELTSHVGLNHNAVRQHLAKLVEARLVVEAVGRPAGRGRPPLQYTVDPSAQGRWGSTGPYERLSGLLSEVIRTGDTPLEVGRRAGRRERLGAGRSARPVDELVERMARHGFEPTVSHTADRVDITLHACPFVTTAMADPDTVCQLHLGLALGIADELGGLQVDALVPRDPRQARCVVHCRVTDSGTSTT
ncbi:MAG TPA: helix-turn-helix domain-containing protein [Ilumatobacteraceae bacterium]|nr:helix-turn-helix domain-containing protein [Ilumatobacteraceae bacterium]